MKRTARAAVTMPLIVLVAGGLLEIACRGGGTLDGLDGGFDGEAARLMPGISSAQDESGDACVADNAGSGAADCTSDDE